MTKEELKDLRIGMLIFRKSDGLVAELTSGFLGMEDVKPEHTLWTDRTMPSLEFGGVEITISNCDDWERVNNYKELSKNPIAYCNHLNIKINKLTNELKTETVL